MRRSARPDRRRAAPHDGRGRGVRRGAPKLRAQQGGPIVGASLQDLQFYADGARRTLGDPSKARWHDKERSLLAALEAEIARQQGGGGGGHAGSSGGFDDDAPPPGDDDIPF